MQMRRLGRTGPTIMPIVFGGNVFGWTVDEATSFALLDAFVDHGFDAIDTADVYSRWFPGNQGGESETIIGRWLKARPGMRERVRIFTKVGMDLGGEGRQGLSPRWIAEAVEGSLRRLGTDRIDLYFAHKFDPETPQSETLGAFDALVRAGKVLSVGASNFDAPQLREALDISSRDGLARYEVIQPEYNLYGRGSFEGPLRDLCLSEEIGVVPYYALASGFLTGKYRSKDDLGQSVRGQRVGTYFDARGMAILGALDEVAAAHDATCAEVALAWLMARQGVTAPIASGTRPAHIETFARSAALDLTASEQARLDSAGA
ncbi:aldo/keto reductase [Ameyamaea chiangmaiensis NBRC 103196]|uniref:Aldo/keto reductase n=1 Tax=Ameyamaea chiangmaiensis TaxID=442969 RepID=A0A850PFI5_9PROT|nr:aldo/keto reductase [Ameyamaea chiangmaiensis]MBS4075193.1 aldo/keto reductase [Ameyamaea chiangmaiensis]NVN41210.1 aldo/keto reductase [Ameyamaea chiangmaiensis]GBQ66368.1 aldo/keto reductase [Ameyamaea chiangmaiensis NBRC 103196]